MTRRIGVLLAATVCVSAAACDDDSTGPSNLPLIFTAQMSAANETTPVGAAEASARGAATVTFNVTRDSAGAITSGTVDMNFQVANLPQGASIILAHVHTGAAGVAGPVLIDTGLRPTSAIPASSAGTVTFNVTGIAVDAANINAIVANPGGFYFNVHSAAHPAGVVRGQLSRIQ